MKTEEKIEELEELQKIYSFSKLQEKFEKWELAGQLEDYKDLFVMGYSSLISYPAIVLTKDFTADELRAAQRCYDLMMQYGQPDLQRMAKSENEKSRLAAMLISIPPAKRLLAGCNRFYLLNYLVQAVCDGKNLSDIDGNEFAKQWNHILSNGYNDEYTTQNINNDSFHRNSSWRAIIGMSLSEESKSLLSEEQVKNKMENYFHQQRGSFGCMIVVLITGALGLLTGCI